MSKTAVIVSLVVALGLALLTALIVRPAKISPPPARIQWLSDLASANPSTISVRFGDGTSAELFREPVTETWLLRPQEKSPAWPVASAQVRGLMRAFAELAGAPENASASTLADATTLAITVGGKTRSIRVAGSAIGGRVAAAIDLDSGGERRVFVEDSIRRVLAREGLLAWRKNALLAREGFDPTRVRVERPEGKYTLDRVGGRWTITLPLIAPCDPAEFATLREVLSRLSAARFAEHLPTEQGSTPQGSTDDGVINDDSLGFANAWAFLSVESEIRMVEAGEVRRRVLVESARFGTAADAGGKSVHVRLVAELRDPATNAVTPAWGPVVAVVERERLAALAPSAMRLVSPVACTTPPADVLTIELTPATPDLAPRAQPASEAEKVLLARGLKGWEKRAGTAATQLPEDEQPIVEGLLRALGEARAAAVALTPPEGVRPLAQIRLGSNPGEIVVLGVVPGARAETLVVHSPPIVRTYEITGVERIREWLQRVVKPEG